MHKTISMASWEYGQNSRIPECGQRVILGLARACSMPARLGNKVLLAMAEACRHYHVLHNQQHRPREMERYTSVLKGGSRWGRARKNRR
jgi:hypothetical protein